MSTVNTRRVPSRTFLCCIPVRAGVVVSFAFYFTYYSAISMMLVPFPSWLLGRRCNGNLCNSADKALTYACLAYLSCSCQTHARFLAGTTGNKLSLIIQIVIYILLAILSVIGFVYVPFLSYHCSLTRSQFDWSHFTKARVRPIILLDGLTPPSVKHWPGCIRYCSQL